MTAESSRIQNLASAARRQVSMVLLAALFGALSVEPAVASEPSQGADGAGEIVDVRRATWAEVADRCRQDPGSAEVAPGYFVSMALGDEVYQVFVNRELALLCGTIVKSPSQPEAPADEELRALVEEARRDLSARLRVAPDQIRLRSAERVTWRDSSLGCPKPGQLYSQVLTEGSRVVLIVGVRAYSYHQGVGGALFLCETPSGLEPLPAHEVE